MRILLINHYAGSPGTGMEFRPYYLARHWERMGHEVLIAAGSYSHLRRRNPRLGKTYERRSIEGVNTLFIKTPPYSGNGLNRFVNVQAFVAGLGMAAGPIAGSFKPDVVISSSTYPFDAFAARTIADRAGGIHIHEVHDLWPMTLLSLYGFSPLHPAMAAMQAAEDFALSHSDHVVSMLPGVGHYLAERGHDATRFSCIPNGIEPDEPVLPPPPEVVDAFWESRRRYRHNVLYLGGFGGANGLDDYLRIAALRPEVLFVAVGDGPCKAQLVRQAAESGLRNLLFLPPVAHRQVYATLCLADMLYIGTRRSELYRYGVGMNKLYEYMASGRPVISAMDAFNDPVAQAGCGLSVPPENPQAAAAAIDRLIALGGEGRCGMGQRGMDFVARHHSYPLLAAHYIKLMEDVRCEKKVPRRARWLG